jgi:hypothetical protein
MRLLGHLVLIAACTAVSTAQASQSTQPPATSGTGSQTAPQQTLSSSLGVYVFPAKHQTPEQQNTDEGACFSWAKGQTGIDPMAPASESAANKAQDQAQQSQASQSKSNPTKGSGAKGAAGGAAAGAAIGAIAGDAGTGAAAGATAGAVRGRRQAKKAQKQQEKEQQQAQAQEQQQAQQQAQAQQTDRRNTYNKAFGACMEGKGYTVK